MLFIEINSLYLINNNTKNKDMDLNIKGFIHLDFRKFKSGEELVEYTQTDDNFDTLANIYFNDEKGTILNYKTLYNTFDEIWIVNNYLVGKREKNSDEIKINPDLSRYLLENSFNYVNENNKEREEVSEKFVPDLSVDSILDRITEVGINNITKQEKEFLDKNS